MTSRLHELRIRGRRRVALRRSVVRATRFKFLTVVVAVLFVWGEFAHFAHFASVRHRVCAEHGEIEDVAAHPCTDRPIVPADDYVGPSPSGDQEHEHCALIDKNRDMRAPWSPATRVCFAKVEVRDIPRCVAPAFAGFPRYRLAPKHSPPA